MVSKSGSLSSKTSETINRQVQTWIETALEEGREVPIH